MSDHGSPLGPEEPERPFAAGRGGAQAPGGRTRRAFRIGRLLHADARRDLDDELEFHFRRTIAELMEGGMSEERAEAEARRRFGDEERWRSELRRVDRSTLARRRRADGLLAVADDVRHGIRALGRSPMFTAGVVLTFALGLGANATIFGILDRVLLSPPEHVVEPDRVKRVLVDQYRDFMEARQTRAAMAYADFADLRSARSIEAVAAYQARDLTVGSGEDAHVVRGLLATGGLFELLGVRPALGRFYSEEEDRPGGEPVVVVGHGYWQRELGGDPAVLGKTLELGNGPQTIVGVAPQGFTGLDLEPIDLIVPLRQWAEALRPGSWETTRTWHWTRAVARLAPGATLEGAEAEATALHRAGRSEQIAAEQYDEPVQVVLADVIAARGPLAGSEAAVATWLGGVSLLVLLIACANVANLLLARGLRRRREIGIRLALGVSRVRLLRQALLESLLLAFAGGAAALLVARWGGELVRSVLLPGVSWSRSATDTRVLLFVGAAALVAGLAAGLLPAWQATRPRLGEMLKGNSRTVTGTGARTRAGLTIAQAALSVVLLVGAGLFLRSLDRVRDLDMGFEPDGLLLVELSGARDIPAEEQTRVFEAAQERLNALPGVVEASAVIGTPFWSSVGVTLRIPGIDSIPVLPSGTPTVYAGGGDFLQTLGIDVVRGRGFGAEATRGTPRVAVVNETMARTIWPEEDAIGKCLRIEAEDAPCATVVGVVEDMRRHEIIEEAGMSYYVPLAQGILSDAPDNLLVRVDGDARALVPMLRRELLALDTRIRFADVRAMSDIIDPQARSWRLGATLFTIFGVLALLVAAIGLYSVLAFDVAQRTREIGIRAALGATRERLLRLVMAEGLRVALVGVALGAAAAFLLAPRLEALLFETPARDPLVFAGVGAVLLVVAILASGLPALRATRVEPRDALQAE